MRTAVMARAAIPRFGIGEISVSSRGEPVAWAMSEAASEIGIAKPRPWASVETAVLMPMTRPFASSSGPPLLPGLIAASVWSRPVSVSGRPVASSWTVIVRPVAGQDALGHGLGERAERAADGDDRLADLEWSPSRR